MTAQACTREALGTTIAVAEPWNVIWARHTGGHASPRPHSTDPRTPNSPSPTTAKAKAAAVDVSTERRQYAHSAPRLQRAEHTPSNDHSELREAHPNSSDVISPCPKPDGFEYPSVDAALILPRDHASSRAPIPPTIADHDGRQHIDGGLDQRFRIAAWPYSRLAISSGRTYSRPREYTRHTPVSV